MAKAKWWIVCYDVHDDKRLRQCAKHLEGYGDRIQYSVFRCWMTARDVERLRWELTEILKPADDVLLMPLCKRCVDDILGVFGDDRQLDWLDQPPGHHIV